MILKKLTASLISFMIVITSTIPPTFIFADETTVDKVYTVGIGEGKYSTINDALAQIKTSPTNEENRVYINIDPGNYEEQVIFDNMKYITLRKTPGTIGTVNLYWYYCTGYAYSNCDLDGKYNPNIDWADDRTWNGYNEDDEKFIKYEIGQVLKGKVTDETGKVIEENRNIEKISYYDKNGVAHKDQPVKKTYLGSGFPLDGMAPLCVKANCTDIVIEDLHIVNSVPVMVTPKEKEAHITPEDNPDKKWKKPVRDNLTICSEDTPEEIVTNINTTIQYNASQSAYIVRSSKYNERGHAISINGDRCILRNVYARGNQDSVYIGSGRIYFEDCDLIGGTDYIYGGAAAVFNNCKLGLEGMSDNPTYGSPITAAETYADNPYGYLFYNCEIYNNRPNNTSESTFGRPWHIDPQVTFFNTIIDDNGTTGKSPMKISAIGWDDMGELKKDGVRFYEYNTINKSDGKRVDTTKRPISTRGMGTLLDDWQILEFNPVNYFKGRKIGNNTYTGDWDPMNFGDKIANVEEAIENININVPEGNETKIQLPTPENNNLEYKWESASPNAIISNDGTSMEIIRPALGETAITAKITLYVRNKTTLKTAEAGLGNKRDIEFTIAATTDTTNIFNIPVTIKQSVISNSEHNYTVSVTKNGALIKEQIITVPAGQLSVSKTIENIPANIDGIEYDIKVVPSSDEFTIAVPENGISKIIGKTGEDINLEVSSIKIIDDTVNTKASFYEGTTAITSFDIIKSAKDNGASSDIETSDIITIDYDINVSKELNDTSYIDLTSGTAGSSVKNGADSSRFVLWRIYKNWNQLDMVDCGTAFSGAGDLDGHQTLNITGKFDYKTINHVSTTINYKTKTITVKSNGVNSLKEKTLKEFPENFVKGKLNLIVYSVKANTFSISNINVTYKKIPKDNDITNPDDPNIELVDDTISLTDSFDNGMAESKSFDIISLAKASGADISIDKSDTITFEYDIDVTKCSGGNNTYFNLTSKIPESTCNTNADSSRFILWRIYHGWNQFDMVDCTTKFDGFTDLDGHQKLNMIGKFDFNTTNHVSATIDYKNKTVTVKASGINEFSEYTFPAFPLNYEKGNLYFAVYPGNKDELTFSISNMKVTYKKIVEKEDLDPTPGPDPDTQASILNAEILDGNTVVTLKNIDRGVLVAAKYDGEKLKTIKTSEVKGSENTYTINGIEADKVFVWNSLENMEPLCETYKINALGKSVSVDFTKMNNVPAYSSEKGQGFVSQSNAIMPDGYNRKVADISQISISENGASITENGNGTYLKAVSGSIGADADDHNFGGLIYRVDTGAPGAYKIEVEITGNSADTTVAPTGMLAERLTGTSPWDTAKLVERLTSAKWEGSKWSYDFATGEDFIEIEIEPKELPKSGAEKTVGVKSIKITPIENNPAGDKPTIHILGDSTQKTYTFFSTISSWGQTLIDYFDPTKVNVVNYSMGGRAMKSNYFEGRFDDILLRGKEGDYVFIHSAHNDETGMDSNKKPTRFVRGCQYNTLEKNNDLYNKWLDMYIKAIKSRGMTPVLVTAMPRTGNGRYSESTSKPNGFDPDSPANMREKAMSDSNVGLVELYDGAKAYINSLDANEIFGIYNSIEAGESPAASDGSSQANGQSKSDGTHYRESAARQWCRIMLQSMYDQSIAPIDTYKDKAIMTKLVSYMKDNVKNAAKSKDWSKVFPEMALDVSAKGIVPGAVQQPEANYYYRNSIEKVLQLGIMKKDSSNKFYPTNIITVGDFARSVEKAFGLDVNSLTSYTRTYTQLQTEGTVTPLLTDTYKTESNKENQNIKLTSAESRAGEFTVTVNQPKGGKVTIYNESDYQHATANITEKVDAETVISDNEYFTLIAPNSVIFGTDSNGVFPTNKEITTSYIESKKADVHFNYKAKATGTLTAYVAHVETKTINLVDINDNKNSQAKYLFGEAGTDNKTRKYAAIEFNVEAGKEYTLYTNGGTGRLFGVQFATEQDSSTETLSVSNGTKIRVVAERNAINYKIDGISVNGQKVSSDREYEFTVTNNTTVSAILSEIVEPSFVETTIIPSDAKLTRQAMGAILYDAYLLKYKTTSEENRPSYMTKHNGTALSPDDPNYDPNIPTGDGVYYPITDWFSLKDRETVNKALYHKVKSSYNLGLMRADTNAARGKIFNGDSFEPEVEVTRAKAAKTLAFIYILTQDENAESQALPNGNLAYDTEEISVPNVNSPSVPVEIK